MAKLHRKALWYAKEIKVKRWVTGMSILFLLTHGAEF